MEIKLTRDYLKRIIAEEKRRNKTRTKAVGVDSYKDFKKFPRPLEQGLEEEEKIEIDVEEDEEEEEEYSLIAYHLGGGEDTAGYNDPNDYWDIEDEADAMVDRMKEQLKITKSHLSKMINEEISNILKESVEAVVIHDEGLIETENGDYLHFDEIQGTRENPNTGDEIERIILKFFDDHNVSSVRDTDMDPYSIDSKEWLRTVLMNLPGSERRPPKHTAGGHSIRDLRAQGIDPSDPDAF